MCFDQKTSFAFSALALAGGIYCWKTTRNFRLTVGVFFFFLMEFLQGLQYFVIDECDNPVNKFLTVLGMFHICLQPFFTHYMISGLVLTPKGKSVYSFILKLSLLGCGMLALRWPLSYIEYFQSPENVTAGFLHGQEYEGGPLRGHDSVCGRSPEWLRGREICTFSGRKHLGWSMPLASISYHLPSSYIHFFCMFAPFFALKQYSWVYGFFLMLTGPILARAFTDDLMEQASMWCFWSTFQVLAMVFAIRFFFNNPEKHEKFRQKLKEQEKARKEKKEAELAEGKKKNL